MSLKSMVHAGNCGDVLAALPAMRQYYRNTGIKPILYLVNGHIAKYYDGAVHPIKNENGETVSLNSDMINMLIPLLKEQDYLEDVKERHISEFIFSEMAAQTTDGERHLNLSFIRETFCNIPKGDIRRWYFYPFADLACDLSKQYIHVPDSEKNLAKGKIIICRTQRYLNEDIDYSFLKEYEDNLLFSGTMREYKNFCMNFELNIQKLHISNFLELAQALKQSRGLISNQTMIFQIAEGLKIPRCVELCNHAPNVIPVGKKAYDFYGQVGLELYFHEFNRTKRKYINEYKKKTSSVHPTNDVNVTV